MKSEIGVGIGKPYFAVQLDFVKSLTDPPMTMDEAVKLAKALEDRGYRMITMAQGQFVRLAIIGRETKKVLIGPSVVSIYGVSPWVTAMHTMHLDEISGGRAILGLGWGGEKAAREEEMGIKVGSLKGAMQEYLEIERKLFKEATVNYMGEHYKVRMGFPAAPVRDRIPIYIGAVGDKALEWAGEFGDGVQLNPPLFLDYVKFAVERVHVGAKRQGRDPSEIDIQPAIVVSVSNDVKAARDYVKRRLPFWLIHYPTEGFIIKGAGFSEQIRKIKEAAFREIEEAGELPLLYSDTVASLVTDEMVDAYTVCGTAKECRRKLEEYHLPGVTGLFIFPIAPTSEATLATALEIVD
jgi:5,10-methylenetetrahydromethanopterin reductase